MSVFINIENALNTKLATLSGSPAVQWPNTRYQPSENTPFLRPTILPAATVLDTLAGTEEHKGIYQIDVFVPLEKGISAVNTLLDSIATLFRASKTLAATDIVFIQSISRGKAERQESWYVSFVQINYICYS